MINKATIQYTDKGKVSVKTKWKVRASTNTKAAKQSGTSETFVG